MITDAEYQTFVLAVRELQDTMRGADLSTFALTKAERSVLAALPDEIVQAIDEQIAQYTTSSDLDIRNELVQKGLALLLLKLSTLEKAVKLGTEIGGELV